MRPGRGHPRHLSRSRRPQRGPPGWTRAGPRGDHGQPLIMGQMRPGGHNLRHQSPTVSLSSEHYPPRGVPHHSRGRHNPRPHEGADRRHRSMHHAAPAIARPAPPHSSRPFPGSASSGSSGKFSRGQRPPSRNNEAEDRRPPRPFPRASRPPQFGPRDVPARQGPPPRGYQARPPRAHRDASPRYRPPRGYARETPRGPRPPARSYHDTPSRARRDAPPGPIPRGYARDAPRGQRFAPRGYQNPPPRGYHDPPPRAHRDATRSHRPPPRGLTRDAPRSQRPPPRGGYHDQPPRAHRDAPRGQRLPPRGYSRDFPRGQRPAPRSYSRDVPRAHRPPPRGYHDPPPRAHRDAPRGPSGYQVPPPRAHRDTPLLRGDSRPLDRRRRDPPAAHGPVTGSNAMPPRPARHGQDGMLSCTVIPPKHLAAPFAVTVRPTSKISYLKSLVHGSTQVPPHEQDILFGNGPALDPNLTVSEVGIRNGSQIHLVVKSAHVNPQQQRAQPAPYLEPATAANSNKKRYLPTEGSTPPKRRRRLPVFESIAPSQPPPTYPRTNAPKPVAQQLPQQPAQRFHPQHPQHAAHSAQNSLHQLLQEKQQADMRIKQLEQQIYTHQEQKPPLPSEPDASTQEVWVEATSAKGYKYYYNLKTQETNWVAPPGAQIYQEEKKNDKPTPNGPSQPQWQKLMTSDGYEYWYDSTTGATSWENPAP